MMIVGAGAKIWVAGHTGMVGPAITRHLTRRGDDVLKANHATLDLRDPTAVEVWLEPDGTPRKLMDSNRIAALGWKLEISLEEGIARTNRWYLSQSALKFDAMSASDFGSALVSQS